MRDLSDDRMGARRRRRGARRARALRAHPALHRGSPTAATSGTTCSRPTSRRARPTCPSSSYASATASPTAARLYLAPCAKLLTAPGLDQLRELARRAPRCTPRTSPAARRTSAARGCRWLDEHLRSPPRPALWPRRPGRRRRGDVHVRRRSRRHRGGHAPRASGSAASLAPAPTCPSSRAGAEVVAIDAPRPSGAVWQRLGVGRDRASAPTRSSTSRRAQRASTPRSTWRLYSALADGRGCLPARARRRSRAYSSGASAGATFSMAIFVNCSADPISTTADPGRRRGARARHGWPRTRSIRRGGHPVRPSPHARAPAGEPERTSKGGTRPTERARL